MKPFALSITQSLVIVLCYLSLAAHLTSAIWSSDRPRNKVSVAATARGTKQNVGLIDEAMKVLGLDEFFGTYDTDNDDDDNSDESDEYKVKYSNAIERHSDDSTNEYVHMDRISNKKSTRNNSSNNNSSNRTKGEQDKPASSFYSDIESALEQATDKVESLWLQFKQGVHSLMPDLSYHKNGNDDKEQIKPIQTTKAIETSTERPITRITRRQIETTTEKPPIITGTKTEIKIITDKPLTNGPTESSNTPAEETTTEQSKMEAPPPSENLVS